MSLYNVYFNLLLLVSHSSSKVVIYCCTYSDKCSGQIYLNILIVLIFLSLLVLVMVLLVVNAAFSGLQPADFLALPPQIGYWGWGKRRKMWGFP